MVSIHWFDFYWMFNDHLSAYSLLAKWVNKDEVGLKEKPEDTRYIKIRPLVLGVRAKELDLNFCHYWDCRLGKVQVRQP